MVDISHVRNAYELETKYNFSKLLGLKENVESNSENIVKVNNELNNALTSIIINLGDTLASQTDVSLWFYSGIPSTTNLPYTSWANPSEHIGDFYYNQETGYVYKFNFNGWELQTDTNLIKALALTNADIDTQSDHERKVYFNTPSPPYSSGDWWILEDGTLKICQLGKNSADKYDEQDFVVSSKYTSTVATKQGNKITVLQGTVTEFSKDYVKFTDLATKGSTTIAGDNISTGAIKSNNYVSGTAGMSISLSDGTIDSKNLKLLSNGDLDIGGYIKTSKGILCNFQVKSGDVALGQNQFSNEGTSINITQLDLDVSLPKNFEVVQADITVNVFKTQNTFIYNDTGNEIINYGKIQNIKLYKEDISTTYDNAWLGTFSRQNSSQHEISGAFGTNGYTNSTSDKDIFKSQINLKDNLLENKTDNGITAKYVIKTSDSKLNNDLSGITTASQQTQIAYATLNIIGYMSIS